MYAYFQEIVADVLHHFHADHSIERALPLGRQGPVIHEMYADSILEPCLLYPLFRQFELIAGQCNSIDGDSRYCLRAANSKSTPAGTNLQDLTRRQSRSGLMVMKKRQLDDVRDGRVECLPF